MKTQRISQGLRSFLGYSDDKTDASINQDLNKRLRTICKPCWELNYCPYGPLVEDFPLPPLTPEENDGVIAGLKQGLEQGYVGTDALKVELTDLDKQFFCDLINTEMETSAKLSKFEQEAACNEYGHLCPVYFVSEPIAETRRFRKATSNIAYTTVVKVVHRDKGTCQICGKALLDRKIVIEPIIPYSRGGSSDESNLRVTCLDCNQKKA